MAQKPTRHVVIFGDAAIDWIDYPEPAKCKETNTKEHCRNWSLRPGTNRVAMGGGSFMLTEFIKAATKTRKVSVSGPELPHDISDHSKHKIHSYMRVANYETDLTQPAIWRISELNGFSRPDPSNYKLEGPSLNKVPKADLLVIDDAANGCRHTSSITSMLNKALYPSTTLIYKMSRPVFFQNEVDDSHGFDCSKCTLWTWARKHFIDPINAENLAALQQSRLIVLLDAEDLRTEECEISKGLSWERTAVDAANALLVTERHKYRRFFHCSQNKYRLACWLIVRFGIDGAIVFPPGCDYDSLPADKKSLHPAILIYDRAGIEDKFDLNVPGMMAGYSSVITAVLTASITEIRGKITGKHLVHALKQGLTACRAVLMQGFIKDIHTHPVDKIVDAVNQPPDKCFQDVFVPHAQSELHRMTGGWSIITAAGLGAIEAAAYNVVQKGVGSCDRMFPVAKFGELTTIDKSEIEGYRNIERLVREYAENTNKTEPLCLAVFGQPGAGKSFGVKQVIKSILGKVETLSFNVSEFTSPRQLARAFHQVSDKTGGKNLPLIFFDEFDSKFNDQRCGWLKFFLAPMNDGEFNDGMDTHPIGRAIFVFAGGTFHSFSDLARECGKKIMKDAKAPDFVSRLRGYLNILGANPAHETDYTCMLRRASTLYANFTKRAEAFDKNTHWFMDSNNHIRINKGVARAFLKAPEYKNSTRSLIAIMEMSSLSCSKGYTKSALPPGYLLDMQVDSGAFLNLVRRNAIFLPAHTELAKMIHAAYVSRETRGASPVQLPNVKSWKDLSEEIKESNRQQLDTYLNYLSKCNYSVDLAACPEAIEVGIAAEDIDKMAEWEHERWSSQKKAAGWQYGEKRNDELRLHPNLVEWNDKRLSEEDKDKDRNAIRDIPFILKSRSLIVIRIAEDGWMG